MTNVQAIFVRKKYKKVHYSYILDLTNNKLFNINKTFAVYMYQGREEPVEYLMWNILFNDKSPLMLEVIFSMIWYDWNIVFKDLFPDCIQQNYGDDCSLPCSEFCVDGRCNSSNGMCLMGCQPGNLGSHCNRSKNIHITLISTCMYKFSQV